jgi:para-aminobenzoate synthetase/4-amino-4-deoxychorismate lyase
VALAGAPIDAADPFVRNKTTNRAVYELARRQRPDVEDVLLWNGRGEVTESTIANVVADIGGVRWTPPAASGLLPGVFRAELLDAGIIRERILTKADVAQASGLWLVNSVREWIDAVLV